MSEVRVRFLGSGDAFGSGGRFQACILVETEETRFLIDCGASSLVAMKRFGVDPNSLDAILLSHLHGDHFGGLPFFILDGQFGRRTAPLTIVGPPGTETRVRAAMEVLFPGSSETRQRFEVRFVEYPSEGQIDPGGLRVRAYEVRHESGAPACALRIECGEKVIGYSGDTDWMPALAEAAADTDLFISEASFFDKKVPYHLDYETLASHRPELRCGRLILTHLSADMLARRDEVDAEIAEDGAPTCWRAATRSTPRSPKTA